MRYVLQHFRSGRFVKTFAIAGDPSANHQLSTYWGWTGNESEAIMFNNQYDASRISTFHRAFKLNIIPVDK